MGEIPPGASQDPSRKAAGTMASGHSRESDRAFTAPSISAPRRATFRAACRPLIESEAERGGIQAAPICRHLQPIPRRYLPALWAADAEVPRPLPQRRLQALAIELRRLGGVPGVARGRSRPR